jgi:hypothetical protein
MAFRLPGGRVDLAFEDGPYTGLHVEVETVGAWPIHRAAVELASAFFAATGSTAELRALTTLYGLFVVEAEPAWDIEDHHGRVPTTAAGMLRLPLALALRLCELWAETFAGIEAEDEAPATAVDELIPPGSLRDQLNETLARKRAEAA